VVYYSSDVLSALLLVPSFELLALLSPRAGLIYLVFDVVHLRVAIVVLVLLVGYLIVLNGQDLVHIVVEGPSYDHWAILAWIYWIRVAGKIADSEVVCKVGDLGVGRTCLGLCFGGKRLFGRKGRMGLGVAMLMDLSEVVRTYEGAFLYLELESGEIEVVRDVVAGDTGGHLEVEGEREEVARQEEKGVPV
jgi:hypothetical protein